jgi:predicted TPR repeat methyltransferase
MTKKFLDKAYQLTDGAKGTRALYDAWAASYEAEVGENGYATPGRCAKALMKFAKNPATPVLDFGCGTGLSGLALKLEGFSTIDGLDLSPDMLALARAKSLYRTLTLVDPDAPLPVRPGDYRIIAAIGVIGVGAAPLTTFDTLMKLLPKSGLLVFSFNDHALADWRYEAKVSEWTDCGAGRLLFRKYGPHLPGANLQSNVYVIEKA